MKKYIAAAALTAGLAFVPLSAQAGGYHGYHHGHHATALAMCWRWPESLAARSC